MTKKTLKSKPLQSNFFEDVYKVVKLIPKGRVSSYGTIAKYLGAKGSARMVGWAMNSAHGLEDVPAHRVVNRNGLLTAKHHFSNPDEMQTKLEAEGIIIRNDKIISFNNIHWDPSVELD
ncbi:MAG: MGMT family protein [Bacteroidota bacterium]|nr:MGMT family protein [Bacteroidota bacterium]